MNVTIAAAQITITSSIEKNLQEILKAIAKASTQKASFVVLPETCLVSESKLVRPVLDLLKQIYAAAKEYSINVIFGSYVLVRGRIKNRILVVSKEGVVVHRYDKRNLFMQEPSEVVAGKRNRVLELDGVPFGVINCWDYAFPEQQRRLAKNGAKIIFCPANLLSHPRTKNVLLAVPQVRAFDSMAYFVMVDGFHKRLFCQTRICHPLRELARISDEPGMVCVDVDLKEIDLLRKEFPNF